MADFTVRGLIEIIIKGGPAADEAKQKLDAMVRSLAAGGPAAAAVTAQFEALARSADSLGVRGKRAGDELRKALASGDVAGTSAAVQKTLDLLDKKRDRVINSAPDTEISRTGAFDPAKYEAPLKKLTDSFLKAGEAKKTIDGPVGPTESEKADAILKRVTAEAEEAGAAKRKLSEPLKIDSPDKPFREVQEASERAAATIRKARGEQERLGEPVKIEIDDQPVTDTIAEMEKLAASEAEAREKFRSLNESVKTGSAESVEAIKKVGDATAQIAPAPAAAGQPAPARRPYQAPEIFRDDVVAGGLQQLGRSPNDLLVTAARQLKVELADAKSAEAALADSITAGSAQSADAIKKVDDATSDLGRSIAKTTSAGKTGAASPTAAGIPSTSRTVQDNAAAGTQALESEAKAAAGLEAALARVAELGERAGAVSDGAKEATAELAEAAKAAHDFGGALDSAASKDALGDLAGEAKTDSEVVKEALAGIRTEVSRLGLDAEKETGRIEQFTAGIAKAGGPIQAQTIPAFRDFLKITHDVPATMAMVKAAIATAGEVGTSFDAVMKGVAATIRGQVEPAAKGLGITLTNEDGTLKETEQLLREVAEANVYLTSKARVARAEIDAQEKATRAAGDGFAHLGHSVRDVLGAFGIIIGIREVVTQLKDAVLDFAEVERGINAIGLLIENLGIASRTEAPRIREALEAIALDGGAKLKESIPTFEKFVGITQDVSAALYLTQLASNAADTGITTLDGAVEALAGIMQGRAAQGAKTLGIQLLDHNGAVRDAVELLKQAGVQYDNVHREIDDTKQSLDKARASWNQFWIDIGAGLTGVGAGAINFFSALEDRITGFIDKVSGKAFNIYAKVVLDEPDPAGRLAREREQGLGAASPWAKEKVESEPFTPADATKLFPDHSEAVEAGKQFQEAFEDGRARALAFARTAEDRVRRKAELDSDIERLQAQIQSEDELSTVRLQKEIDLLEKKRTLDLLNSSETHESESRINARYDLQEQAKRDEFDRKVAQAKLHFTEELRQQTLQREVAGAAEGSQARLDAELAILQSRRTVAVAEAKRLHADVAAVEREYDQQQEATIVRNELKRQQIARQGEESILKDGLAIVGKGTQAELDLRLRLLDLELADELDRVRGNETEKVRLRLQFAMEKANTVIDVGRERVTKQRDQESAVADSGSELRKTQIQAELDGLEQFGGSIERIKRLHIELIDEEARAEQRRLMEKLAGDLLEIESERRKNLERIKAQEELDNLATGVPEETAPKNIKARAEAEEDASTKVVAKKKETDNLILASDTKRTSAEDILTKKAAAAKREHYGQMASQAITAAQAIFGQSKGLAIAAALADTWAAANRALAEGGPYLGPVLAGLMVAAGLKNVANIKNTNLGSEGGGGASAGTAAPTRPNTGAPQVSFQGNAASARPTGFAGGGQVPGRETGRDEVAGITPDGRTFPIGSGEIVNDLSLSRQLIRDYRAQGGGAVTGPGGFGLKQNFREWLMGPRVPRARGFALGGQVPGQLVHDEESILAHRIANRIPFERSPLVANLGRGDVESPSEAARSRPAVDVLPGSVQALASGIGRAIAVQIDRGEPGQSVTVNVNMGNVYGGPSGKREFVREIVDAIDADRRTKRAG